MADPGRIPGPEVIPNAAQVRLVWTLQNGHTAHNVLGGNIAGGFTVTSTHAEAIFAAVKASAAWTAWRAALNTGVSFIAVDIRDLRTPNAALASSTGGASAGTGAGPALPPNNAFVVTLRTALAGRANRGRMFLPGLDSTALTAAGVLASGLVTAAVNFASEVLGAMLAEGLTPVVLNPARAGYTSPRTGRVIPARAAGSGPITDAVARNAIVDSQRRRAEPS